MYVKCSVHKMDTFGVVVHFISNKDEMGRGGGGGDGLEEWSIGKSLCITKTYLYNLTHLNPIFI